MEHPLCPPPFISVMDAFPCSLYYSYSILKVDLTMTSLLTFDFPDIFLSWQHHFSRIWDGTCVLDGDWSEDRTILSRVNLELKGSPLVAICCSNAVARFGASDSCFHTQCQYKPHKKSVNLNIQRCFCLFCFCWQSWQELTIWLKLIRVYWSCHTWSIVASLAVFTLKHCQRHNGPRVSSH